MFGPIGMSELLIIFVIALIVFGPRKLPELGRSLGKSLGEFKRASNDLRNTLEEEIHVEEQTRHEPPKPAPAPPRRGPAARHSRRRLTRTQAYMSALPVPGATDPDHQDPVDEQPDEDELDGADGRMSFLDHLDELRKRLVISVTAVFVGFLIAFALISPIFEFIMRPLQEILPDDGQLVYTEPTEAFFLYIKIAALVGLIMAIPVVLWQLWLFVAPGLYGHEKKFAIPFVTLSSLFFIGGCLFSHYLLFPIAWRFLSSFSTDYMTFMPRIQPAFSLYVRLTLACGAVFQMPTLVLFLARVGVVSAGFLLRNTKYAILIIFILAAVLTPTGDPRHPDVDGSADDRALRSEHRHRLGGRPTAKGRRRLTEPVARRGAIPFEIKQRGGPHPSDRCSSQLRWNPGS